MRPFPHSLSPTRQVRWKNAKRAPGAAPPRALFVHLAGASPGFSDPLRGPAGLRCSGETFQIHHLSRTAGRHTWRSTEGWNSAHRTRRGKNPQEEQSDGRAPKAEGGPSGRRGGRHKHERSSPMETR